MDNTDYSDAVLYAAKILGGKDGDPRRVDREVVNVLEDVDALCQKVNSKLKSRQLIAMIIHDIRRRGVTCYHTGSGYT